jgi:hypothetical protein
MTPSQELNFQKKKNLYEAKPKYDKDYTQGEIILLVLAKNPDNWYFTWELIGSTEFGWLSHASHATLRKLEQEGKIHKDYIDQYVVYTHKVGTDLPQKSLPIQVDRFI